MLAFFCSNQASKLRQLVLKKLQRRLFCSPPTLTLRGRLSVTAIWYAVKFYRVRRWCAAELFIDRFSVTAMVVDVECARDIRKRLLIIPSRGRGAAMVAGSECRDDAHRHHAYFI